MGAAASIFGALAGLGETGNQLAEARQYNAEQAVKRLALQQQSQAFKTSQQRSQQQIRDANRKQEVGKAYFANGKTLQRMYDPVTGGYSEMEVPADDPVGQAAAEIPKKIAAYQALGLQVPPELEESIANSTFGVTPTKLTPEQTAFNFLVGGGKNAADAYSELKTSARVPNKDEERINIDVKKYEAQGMPHDQAFARAYDEWVNQNKIEPGVARMQALAGSRILQVVDPNNPTNVVYMPASRAVAGGFNAPSSIPFQTGRATARDFAVGPEARSLTAFNTAQSHLQLLGRAATAMQNSDFPLLNRVANEWKTQTGGAAPTTFDAIKQALAGEVGKTFTGGVATQGEIQQLEETINKSSSPAAIFGAIHAFNELLTSKRSALMLQYLSGLQGRPAFGNLPGAPGGGAPGLPSLGGSIGQPAFALKAVGPGGHQIGSNDGGKSWYDVQTGKLVK